MMGHFELLLRYTLGIQLIFWGLNGFFHWRQIPPSAKVIDNFTTACTDIRFIMPIVKIFEVVFGVFLLANFAVPLALVLLAPIIFVVTGLHALFSKKSWKVLVPISLPFAVLVILHYEAWRKLLN